MLVLSRKNGESIVIDEAVKVHVLEVKGKVVRLGIDAPKETPIRRSELQERTLHLAGKRWDSESAAQLQRPPTMA